MLFDNMRCIYKYMEVVMRRGKTIKQEAIHSLQDDYNSLEDEIKTLDTTYKQYKDLYKVLHPYGSDGTQYLLTILRLKEPMMHAGIDIKNLQRTMEQREKAKREQQKKLELTEGAKAITIR